MHSSVQPVLYLWYTTNGAWTSQLRDPASVGGPSQRAAQSPPAAAGAAAAKAAKASVAADDHNDNDNDNDNDDDEAAAAAAAAASDKVAQTSGFGVGGGQGWFLSCSFSAGQGDALVAAGHSEYLLVGGGWLVGLLIIVGCWLIASDRLVSSGERPVRMCTWCIPAVNQPLIDDCSYHWCLLVIVLAALSS
jgi:hypothetical protein